MPNSYVEYSTSGTGTNGLGQKVFEIPFNYIAIADVNVKGYNGSTWTDLTVASRDNTAKTVELSAAPSTYQKIRVWRNTSTAQLVDFQNGSRLSETDLDTAYQQGLFAAQEVSENASTEVEGVGQQGPQGIQGPAGADGTDPYNADGDLLADTIKANTADIIAFSTGGAERMRIDSSILRVGNTTGSWPSVDGLILQGDGILQASINNSSSLYLNRGSSNGNIALFARSGTTVGTISVTSSATAFNTSSDYRLKENVVDITDGIARVKQLEPKKFNFIADADTTVDGFLAHEAQEVVPESVTGTKDEVDDEGNPVMQGIDQAKLVPLLTAALQEAIAKIEVLETKVAALEA